MGNLGPSYFTLGGRKEGISGSCQGPDPQIMIDGPGRVDPHRPFSHLGHPLLSLISGPIFSGFAAFFIKKIIK